MKSFIFVAVIGLALASFTEAAKQPAKGIIGNVVNGVTGTVGGVVGGATETVGNVVGGVTGAVGGVVGGVVEGVGGVVEGVGGVVEGVGGVVGGIGGQVIKLFLKFKYIIYCIYFQDQGSLLSQVVKAILKLMEQMLVVLFNLVKITLACIKFLLRSLEHGKLLSAIGTVQTILNTLNAALSPILKLVNALLS